MFTLPFKLCRSRYLFKCREFNVYNHDKFWPWKYQIFYLINFEASQYFKHIRAFLSKNISFNIFCFCLYLNDAHLKIAQSKYNEIWHSPVNHVKCRILLANKICFFKRAVYIFSFGSTVLHKNIRELYESIK